MLVILTWVFLWLVLLALLSSLLYTILLLSSSQHSQSLSSSMSIFSWCCNARPHIRYYMVLHYISLPCIVGIIAIMVKFLQCYVALLKPNGVRFKNQIIHKTKHVSLVNSVFAGNMGVSKNNGTPKSSILIGCSIMNHPFWGTTIFGNTHMWILWRFILYTPCASMGTIFTHPYQ